MPLLLFLSLLHFKRVIFFILFWVFFLHNVSSAFLPLLSSRPSVWPSAFLRCSVAHVFNSLWRKKWPGKWKSKSTEQIYTIETWFIKISFWRKIEDKRTNWMLTLSRGWILGVFSWPLQCFRCVLVFYHNKATSAIDINKLIFPWHSHTLKHAHKSKSHYVLKHFFLHSSPHLIHFLSSPREKNILTGHSVK